MIGITRVFMALFFMLLSCSTLADWNLQSDQSSLNFVSVKKGTVGEVHKFTQLSGSVKASGAFEFSVFLKSVDTGIEIRDQRMQKHLFYSGRFPVATAKGTVDPNILKGLKLGVPVQLETELLIEMYGHKVKEPVSLTIVASAKGGLWVTTRKPLVITAKKFGMSSGVKTLKELAGLPSIAEAVPVTVNLMFAPAK